MEKYRPSNGTEGEAFISRQCGDCIRDKEQRETGFGGCDILFRSMAFSIDDEKYPTEWVQDEDGPRCTAYCNEGSVAPNRCARTIDMFGDRIRQGAKDD